MSAALLPRKRRKEDRPNELLEAALDLFVEKGFAATRLEDIATRAGVSKGTLYLYFAGKEALFKAVIQDGLIPALAELEALLAGHEGSAFDLIRALVERWWSMVGETRYSGIPKLMIAEARNFPEVAHFYYENVVRRGRKVFAAALERGMARGEFRALEVGACVDVLIAPMLMLVVWRHSLAHCCLAEQEPRAYLEMYLEMLRGGLAAPGL
ncbi:MAG: TetR/AcrR family transcriptional regulator [Betaproteobacteria bacterium]|jgi:AcrR family transcriptional regulator|nr:TetR/AcrR family transcriptional regulator [Betaproteobacteria bacterium]HMV21719.1 TetR/AcrR family transcriptional regulator [Rhodocyclaceae bacterium]HMW77718.1 TetR/AcrR family transcriptional regulator [Rhodocyclaceae bacterium]HNE44009.1 TetR/AcrR family transcriptional regulator [Rhodocyclaceae bacterium]HNL22342.1 TetR/AcrR family transcriptional regulator [Rhodocyclaceae bacterium]